jgi:hypothetical protein
MAKAAKQANLGTATNGGWLSGLGVNSDSHERLWMQGPPKTTASKPYPVGGYGLGYPTGFLRI